MSATVAALLGVGGMLGARKLLGRVLLLKLRRDVRALNSGDYRPLLSGYADGAVLRFNDGEHRWAGEHRGRSAIALFLRNFVGAGLQGEITELFLQGPPWGPRNGSIRRRLRAPSAPC